jgi:RimJ/RimL family protein N-acetyltransferase
LEKDVILSTERLVLRQWRPSDREPFARLNADAVVMEHFPGVLNHAESDSFADRIDAHFKRLGFGLWAVQVPGEAAFVGFVGLSIPTFEAPFMPAVEIGWRLDSNYWGRGLASEAARAAITDGFERCGLSEIVSFTVPANIRSIRVMRSLGMTNDEADDFQHPRLPEHHRLRHHVLYRLSRTAWLSGRGS